MLYLTNLKIQTNNRKKINKTKHFKNQKNECGLWFVMIYSQLKYQKFFFPFCYRERSK